MTQDIALVTGAARGIGREVARQLADAGYDVLLAARDAAAARRVADEVGATPVRLDVTSTDDLSGVEALVAERGRLDVLVNNAAAFPDWSETVLTADLDALPGVLDTNLIGPWRLIKTLAPWLGRSVNPRVVNVLSGAGSHADDRFGLGAGPAMASYAVSKAALGALTHKLATELTTARVNAVDPGLTATAPGMEAMGARPVTDGATSVVWAATLSADGPTGGFYRDGRAHPW